jgi:RND superfamily putative drug exporter
MTRRLARLADIAYRRRGRVVLGWIVAAFVIIGLGSSLAGEYEAEYDTPGSESKAARELTERFDGYSGQEIYVVWKDEEGAASPAAVERVDAFFTEAEEVDNVSEHTPIRYSQDERIGSTTLPLTVPGWEVEKEDGEQLIDAAEANSGDGLEIKLGGIRSTPPRSRPARGIGFFGRRSCS